MRITPNGSHRAASRAARLTAQRIRLTKYDTDARPARWQFTTPTGTRVWHGTREATAYALGIADGINATTGSDEP